MHISVRIFRIVTGLLPVSLLLLTSSAVHAQDSLRYKRHDLALTIGRTDSTARTSYLTSDCSAVLPVCMAFSSTP